MSEEKGVEVEMDLEFGEWGIKLGEFPPITALLELLSGQTMPEVIGLKNA